MAAILCKPIASCFEFICTAPCKLCGAGCRLSGECISSACTNPLSAFVAVTFLMQIPLAVAAAFELPGLASCRGSQWMVGMLCVAIAHMFTSVYLAVRVTNSTDEALRDKHTSWERISYLLCHDPWIAIYLLIVIFYVVWLVMGSTWNLNGSLYDGDCDLDNNVAIVLALGWTYLFLGPAILSCNLCCVCCDKKDYAGDEAAFEAKQAEKEAKKASKHSNSNYEADIERPAPPQAEPMSSRTYSADGKPIADTGNTPVVEAQVVIDGDDLPPAMPPPKKEVKSKAEEVAGKATETANKAAKSVGAWFNKKTKNDAPKQSATLY